MWRVLICVVVMLAGGVTVADESVDFARDIEPIFAAHCVDCHGADEQESQFRLDRRSIMLSGGDSGERAIVPSDPQASFLVKLIRHLQPDMEMPPDGSLSDEEIELVEKWIAQGASTPDRYGAGSEKIELTHWSFLPVQRPATASGIDGLIDKELTAKGLTRSEEADRRTLIRRLYLVMLGFPPTPQEVEAFVADEAEDAWEQLVESVLATPHYGERWATHWLDLVRFGETHGFETNRERPHAWRYRDWVIDAFNRDKPYDEFIREQIAGDALGEDVATGYLVAGPYDLVKGRDPSLSIMQRMNELDDMINTTGTAFLGLTTGCARCHNHKFDPITQTDYYAMQAIFAGVQHADRELPKPAEVMQRIAAIDVTIESLTERLKKFLPQNTDAVIAIDDLNAEHLVEPRGSGSDLISESPDLSRGGYTWWHNQSGQDVVRYSPGVRGRYRVWLSWGAGFASHTEDARYLHETTSGRREIARINQQLTADGKGNVDSTKRWSGLYDAGVLELQPSDAIVLQGGESGGAITADVVLFQPARENDSIAKPSYRPALNAVKNVETFSPVQARYVRFTIGASNRGEPCLDELEVYSGDVNLALATTGSVATSSGDFVHPLHRLQHINDGQVGNERSWIAKDARHGWVQIELAETASIDRIVWGRDRNGKFSDRMPVDYRVEVAESEGQWQLVASSSDRWPEGHSSMGEYQFDAVAEAEAEQGRRWLEELDAVREERASLSQVNLVYAGKFQQPGSTYRLYRGEPAMAREEVGPDAIEVFTSLQLRGDAPEQNRRLALAEWIASEDNPLTARVLANRLWQFHFGTGIVDTPSDFGRNGTSPSHPELLDWLAVELVDSGWSIKHLQRLILQSATWKQNNRPRDEAMAVDAGSRLLWRFPPRRLEAEGIRDSILQVTGVLDLDAMGGPGFSAFEIEAENVRHYHPKTQYGPQDWRRMIYMTKVRQERDVVFGVFDCPDASQAVPRRSRSTTPLQALNLLNSQFVLQQAELFANRLQRDAASDEGRVQLSWSLCYQRPATPAEVDDAVQFIDQHGLIQFCRAMLNTNEFVFVP